MAISEDYPRNKLGLYILFFLSSISAPLISRPIIIAIAKAISMNIYVANLNKKTTAHQLFQLFLQFGRVTSVRIVMDDNTGHSLGCGYIEMDDKKCGVSAIRNLHERFFMNAYMEVNEVPVGW